MEYLEFHNAICHYNNLYQQGNKKAASKYIAAFIGDLQKLNDAEIDVILQCFVSNLCDSNVYDFLYKRGNGKIPYAIESIVKKWLPQKCSMSKMPEMRWFYELFHNDELLYEQAYQFLERAYDSTECDDKTVNLLFCSYLDQLDLGAHHFPDGCTITDKERDNAFEKCEKIISEKNISDNMQARLTYYKVLYSYYNHYCKDGKTRI